jgi:hypothetical protein
LLELKVPFLERFPFLCIRPQSKVDIVHFRSRKAWLAPLRNLYPHRKVLLAVLYPHRKVWLAVSSGKGKAD